jgi:fluoride exporter
VSPAVAAAVGTGFCGALSTYSTFSYETLRLLENRARLYAVANVVVALAAGLGAGALGWAVGAALG